MEFTNLSYRKTWNLREEETGLAEPDGWWEELKLVMNHNDKILTA